jgi:hypothetical protein
LRIRHVRHGVDNGNAIEVASGIAAGQARGHFRARCGIVHVDGSAPSIDGTAARDNEYAQRVGYTYSPSFPKGPIRHHGGKGTITRIQSTDTTIGQIGNVKDIVQVGSRGDTARSDISQ